MTTTLLNDLQRTRLRDLAKTPVALAAYTQALQDQYPECFHGTRGTMDQRVFMDAPTTGIPHARSVRSYGESPYRIVPVTS